MRLKTDDDGFMQTVTMEVKDGIFSPEPVQKIGDAFTRWYNDIEARLPHDLNLTQIQGVGAKMRAQTTQHFWKLGEYVCHVENIMREESYQVLDTIGYDRSYLQQIRTAYERCQNMKRKDLPIGAYRALSAKQLTDEHRELLAGKHDELTREGFAALVKEYMVVNGTKAPTLTQGKNVRNDTNKDAFHDSAVAAQEVAQNGGTRKEQLRAAGEAAVTALREQRGTFETTVEAHEAGFAATMDDSVFDEVDFAELKPLTTDDVKAFEAQILNLHSEVQRLQGVLAQQANAQNPKDNAVCLSDAVMGELRTELAERREKSPQDATLTLETVADAVILYGLKRLRADRNRPR